ncbi:MAG TPA: manganese ABC transporter ATP-binding protein [Microscillaceae bacterium]|jgi:manganese/zinc/iron transport system ATP- binding protein|nr:manganese ABC transporter ATP-binding protein [Microscillaceae bacterium]
MNETQAATSASLPAIRVENLTVAYKNHIALSQISFELPQQSLAGIIGPNGSGKTTLLKSLLGVVSPAQGQTQLLGKPFAEVRHLVSYVPQRTAVDWDFPASVWDVVLMGRTNPKNLFRRINAEDRAIAAAALEQVGLADLRKRQIAALSGGQQQRVFLARALAQQADLYLLDEPFAGVDMATENTMMDLLHQMRQSGKTVVVVHHDLQTVKTYFDWVLLLNKVLIDCGPTADIFTTENVYRTYGRRWDFSEKMEMPN